MKLKADEGRFTLQPEGQAAAKSLLITVPDTVKIQLNGREMWQNKPVSMQSLKLDDQVVAAVLAEETENRATAVSITRPELVEGEAVIRNVDADKREITFALGEGENPEMLTLPYTGETEVSVNDHRFVDQQLLKPTDLRPGDKAHEIKHDVNLLRVAVQRVLGQAGVVKNIEYKSGVMEVLMEGAQKPTTFLVKPACKITLAGDPAELGDLRVADVVDITHASVGAENPEAQTISARRPPDPTRWAILIGTQQYEDVLLTPLTTPVADVNLFKETRPSAMPCPRGRSRLSSTRAWCGWNRPSPTCWARPTPRARS